MFVRTELQNRLFPSWKSVSYLNLSNVLYMDVEKNKVNVYTIFRPKYSAYRINFQTNEDALRFADQCMMNKKSIPAPVKPITIEKRFDQPSPDSLAMQAMADWEEEKQLK